jgi:hypothetical protein
MSLIAIVVQPWPWIAARTCSTSTFPSATAAPTSMLSGV